jgi:hypothetical protein
MSSTPFVHPRLFPLTYPVGIGDVCHTNPSNAAVYRVNGMRWQWDDLAQRWWGPYAMPTGSKPYAKKKQVA